MVDFLRPDGKAQVTVEYDDKILTRIDSVVVSTQHSEEVSSEELKEAYEDVLQKSYCILALFDDDSPFCLCLKK